MQRILTLLILAGTLATLGGCRADNGSKTASEMDANPSSAATERMEQPGTLDATRDDAKTPAAARDGRPLVVCFGDSLTAGYGADEGASYPDFLQKDLDRDGFRYRVVNEGISGNTTKDGLDRVSEIVAMKPAVVILEFGGNDGLRGFKVQTTRMNLSTMTAALKGAGAKLVIAGITLPPDYGSDYVTSFTASYPALGKQFNVPVLPFLLKGVYGVRGMMQADNIHATNKGNEVVARNVLPLVEPLLSK